MSAVKIASQINCGGPWVKQATGATGDRRREKREREEYQGKMR